jgi:WD40 repeat protein
MVPATFSIDGRVITTVASSSVVQLWDTVTGVLLRKLHAPSPILTVAFPTDNYLWARSFDGTLRTESKWICLPKMSMPGGIVFTLGFSLDGLHLASGARHNTHSDVAIWDTSNGRRVELLLNLFGAPLAFKHTAG